MGERPMDKYELAILISLDERGGATTGQVAKQADIRFGHSRFTASAFCRQKLLNLQAMAFVRPLDDLKPVCWCRTQEGTAALSTTETRG